MHCVCRFASCATESEWVRGSHCEEDYPYRTFRQLARNSSAMQDLCLHSRRARHCKYMFARSNVYAGSCTEKKACRLSRSYTSLSVRARCRITEAEQSCMCCKEQNGGRNETALVQTRVIGRLNCDCVGRSCDV